MTEPLQDSVRGRPAALVVQISGFVTSGAEMIVGGLCLLGDGRCLALGDLLSLRAVTGDTEAWCLRLPGLTLA